MPIRTSLLDSLKRVIALLEKEMEHAVGLAGFISKPDLLARAEVVRRFGCHLSEISDWWHLPLGRLKDALEEAESVLGGFRATQAGVLRKRGGHILAERLKALSREPWFSYRRAQTLADGLEEFFLIANGRAPLAELRSSYVELEMKFREEENPSAEERVAAILAPPPHTPHHDRKRDKRLRDQALRESLKGENPPPPKYGQGRGKKGRRQVATH